MSHTHTHSDTTTNDLIKKYHDNRVYLLADVLQSIAAGAGVISVAQGAALGYHHYFTNKQEDKTERTQDKIATLES